MDAHSEQQMDVSMMKNGIFGLCFGFFDALLGEPRQGLILGAAFLVLHSWCFGAIYCCCRSLVATFMVLSLGKLLLVAARVAAYLLSWCLGARCCCGCRSLVVLAMLSLGVRFCCCCRSFAVLVMLYRINLVLSAAAGLASAGFDVAHLQSRCLVLSVAVIVVFHLLSW
ncbi:hypothetical protein MAM1_0037c02699 [Mucor ambiguus]|uniref:Uncharacterized protein n=1 Tax=Mucor ambiguus TaxID=91626 RepID=A0A0C9MJD7_9FUNG|nr:hypothetical protein MAM1_0037c02699 [Mucor ambiguus]